MLTREVMMSNAERVVEDFRRRIGGVTRLHRGITVCEAFFVFACATSLTPRQIVESGRARGQSTELFARCFPNLPIISLEHNDVHPDAKIAIDRLADYPNVSCLFGNSRERMPKVTLQGDICVIDGPKDFRAIQLAFDTFERAGPAAIFIHDCNDTSPVRGFLERYVPGVFFSDDPEFRKQYGDLDQLFSDEDAEFANPAVGTLHGTYACLPRSPGCPTLKMRIMRRLYRSAYLIRRRTSPADGHDPVR